MRLVREALGPDAVILSTQPSERGSGVRVTAALEDSPLETIETGGSADAAVSTDEIAGALAYHRVPDGLSDRMLAAAATLGAASSEAALCGALDAVFTFNGLPSASSKRPIMLVGPPGAGKTATAAKLCALARLEGQAAAVVTMDTVKAGGLAQITTFAETLEVELHEADDEAAVERAVAASIAERFVVVDTVGANPFDAHERASLARTASAVGADLTLVLPGGGDAAESAEIAAAFAESGARFLIPTRLDAARRLGGVLAAAQAGGLAFLAAGVSPQIGGGLAALTPPGLARLLLPQVEAAEAPAAMTGTG
jgi:flagellar biosynthesis protein FlhF